MLCHFFLSTGVKIYYPTFFFHPTLYEHATFLAQLARLTNTHTQSGRTRSGSKRLPFGFVAAAAAASVSLL